MQAGTFIKSTSLLDGTFFEHAVIYVSEYNHQGAMGFVINRRFHRNLNELVEFMHAGPFPIYTGGPVDDEHLYFLHRRPELIGGGVPVAGGVYVGGDFSAAVALLEQQQLTGHDIRIFIGYCGWDPGELNAEIAEGSWEITAHEHLF